MSGETNNHDGSTVTHIVDCLLVSEAGRGGDDRSVGAKTVGGGLDVRNDIFCRFEIDPSLSTELEAKLLLVLTSICAQNAMRNGARTRRVTTHTNGDNTETHRDGVLNSKMSETSTSAGKDDPVTNGGVGVLDGTVDGKTLK